jgi:hypothetical protein
MPWRRGVVASVSANETEVRGFEGGKIFSTLYIALVFSVT